MRPDSPIRHKLQQITGWGIGVGILLIILGIIAIVFPLIVTVSTSLLFGWLFVMAGLAQVVYAFQSPQEKHFIWKLLLGILYILAGIFVASSPVITALTLTLILGISIFTQSVIQVVGAFQMRPDRGWRWILFSGIMGIALAILIMLQWPFSAVWFLGVWFGVNFLSDGIGLLMSSSIMRSVLSE